MLVFLLSDSATQPDSQGGAVSYFRANNLHKIVPVSAQDGAAVPVGVSRDFRTYWNTVHHVVESLALLRSFPW